MGNVRSFLRALACLVVIGCSERSATISGDTDSDSSDSDSSDTDSDSSDTDSDSSDSSDTDSDSSETSNPVMTPPELALSFSSIKQFDFSWEPIVEAQWYQLLESANAGEPFVQIGGDIEGESISITMPLHFRVNASYTLRACNADGCSESQSVDVMSNLAEAIGYFKASNTGQPDCFSDAVALSNDGNTLAVGAPGEESSASGIDGDQADDSFNSAGAVYVFVRNGTAWSQQAYVKASNPGTGNWAGDSFGWSVAISDDGHTLAVGAPYEDSSATGIDGDQADDSLTDAGAVYMFVRNGTQWSQQAYVKASNTGLEDNFGLSVALSANGDTLAVGALAEKSNATGIDGDQTDDSFLAAGAVYVFVRDGAVWSQQAYVKASNTGLFDHFGKSVALSADGDTMAVGAESEQSNTTGIWGDQTDNSADHAGAVYVFVRTGGAWSQQSYIKASNTLDNQHFGYSVALSDDGDTLAVSAPWEAGGATGIDGDPFDQSVSTAGAVYVFVRAGAGADWSQQAYVKPSNTGQTFWFGMSVALSSDGDTLVVGAPGETSNATGIDGDQLNDSWDEFGAAYVYVRNVDAWSQQAYVKASNSGEYDHFGSSVALSGDADTLAVGATGEASNATGIGGDQDDHSVPNAGAVYLY